jgi:hypothetical protein
LRDPQAGNTHPFQPSLGTAVMRCYSAAVDYKCCSAAVLRSEGSRDGDRDKRQGEGVDSKQLAVGRVRE